MIQPIDLYPQRVVSRKKIHALVFQYLTFSLAAAIPFSNKISTWCIILLALNWLAGGSLKIKLKKAYQNKIVIVCSLFYLMEIVSLLYTHHFTTGFYNAQTEASILVLPLIYFGSDAMSKKVSANVLNVFMISVFLSSLYCLIIASYHYLNTGNSAYFFYHTLVKPIDQHAVYFSLYVLIAIAYLSHVLLASILSKLKTVGLLSVVIYFIILLGLLRSKLVLFLFLVYAVVQLIIAIRKHKAKIFLLSFFAALLISAMTVMHTSNPISRQFDELKYSDFAVLNVEKFDPSDYFDEVELRLLLWKFSFTILNESHGWLWGVTPGDAQHKLNEQILAHNMYAGSPNSINKGYLNYNVHNQYIETLLRLGITGLSLLLILLYFLFHEAWQRKNIILLIMLLAFACTFFTESVLERQFGVVPFFFFSSIFLLSPE